MKLSDQEVTCALCQKKSYKSLLIGNKAVCFNCVEGIIRYILPMIFKEEEDLAKQDGEILPYIGECQHDHRIGGWEAA